MRVRFFPDRSKNKRFIYSRYIVDIGVRGGGSPHELPETCCAKQCFERGQGSRRAAAAPRGSPAQDSISVFVCLFAHTLKNAGFTEFYTFPMISCFFMKKWKSSEIEYFAGNCIFGLESGPLRNTKKTTRNIDGLGVLFTPKRILMQKSWNLLIFVIFRENWEFDQKFMIFTENDGNVQILGVATLHIFKKHQIKAQNVTEMELFGRHLARQQNSWFSAKHWNFLKFQENHVKWWIFMKFCGFPVSDVNSIDLALVFIRVGAKCGNDAFCVEIVAREWVLCCFHDFCSSFQLFA